MEEKINIYYCSLFILKEASEKALLGH